jgi:hypothetical protein
MHGGRSTGPRTAEGRARIAAAHTIHGRCSAEWRAHNRRILSVARRGRVFLSVMHYLDRLPPDLAARFRQMPRELQLPPYQTGGLTVAQDRAIQRAEAEALAPWKAAVALARQAGRARPVPTVDDCGVAHAAAHAPVPPICDQPAQGAAGGSNNARAVAKPLAPERAVEGGRAIPAAPQAVPVASQTKPLAPERAVDGDRAIPAAPRAAAATPQTRPLAPERSAAGDRAIPAAPQAAAVAPQTKPLAPERAVDGDRAIPAAPEASAATPQTRPLAPERSAAGDTAIPAAPQAAPATQTRPLAPERATPMAGAAPAGLTRRAARRWKRRQKRMRHRPPASPRT